MRTALLVLTVLAMLAVGSTVASAYSTLGGPTGGAVLPDAMVAPAGSLTIAADYTKINLAASEGAYDASSIDLKIIPIRVLYGAGDRTEIWGSWTRLDNSDSTNGWGVGAKYQIMREPDDDVTLAVGAGWNRFNDINEALGLSTYDVSDTDLSSWNVYLVATKDLSEMAQGMADTSNVKILGSLGVLYTKYEDLIDESVFEPFVAVSFTGGKGTSLGLEYRFKDSSVDDKGLFSAVLRHPFTKNLSAQVGVTNGALAGMGFEDFDWFAGLAYTFEMGTGGY